MTGASSGNAATDSSRLDSRATWKRSQRERSGRPDRVTRSRQVSSALPAKFS